MKNCLLLLLYLSFLLPAKAQIYKDPSAAVEDRVESFLNEMTLQEKLTLLGGVDGFYIQPITRLGLPKIKMSDGPVGVRTWGKTTAYPAGISNAATWNRDLVYALGQSLGRDARSRGVHILLAPGVNIYRAPMCGRNFEYFGEDPYLSGQMAVEYIKGVQSKGVVATVKHFAGNNQEYNRYDVSSNIDERTLQEIYLPAFKAAVTEGKTGAVMNAYNLLNGIHCTQNKHLNNDILKGQWKFDGILMSDWGSTHDGLQAALGGLDLEMPAADYMTASALNSALQNGTLTQATIDDKVRRILRIIFRFGFYDHSQTDSSIPADDPSSDSISLKLAREGIVLLKNDSILPLFMDSVKTLAVVGSNANLFVAGGGSSNPDPFHFISVYQGIKDLVDTNVNVVFAGNPDLFTLAKQSIFYVDSGSATRGLKGEYYPNQNFTAPVDSIRTDSLIDFHWPGVPDLPGMPADHFSIRWTGIIRPDSAGTYTFTVRGDDGYRLWINNQEIINNWQDQAAASASANITLEGGKEYPVKLEYYENGGDAEITLAYISQADLFGQMVSAAKVSDAVIVCAGFNSSTEGEGFDRPFSLGREQNDMITAVADANPNTVVIVNAGGNVDMQPWINKVRGILYAWYPGQNGGRALAEILFGLVNPSGKLPASFEHTWAENPVNKNYYVNYGAAAVKYNEGLFVGYRYYDANTTKPLFPFGFGLSYTTFEYSDLSVQEDSTGYFTVSFDIKNTGERAGAEAAQLYVSPVAPRVVRPVKELKDFGKVFLLPGESKTVRLHLDPGSFSYYDVNLKTFIADSGNYKVIIGGSSEDLRLQQIITLGSNIIDGIQSSLSDTKEISRVYPSPAANYVYFEPPGKSGAKNLVCIYDIGGRMVARQEGSNNPLRFDTSSLADGTYMFIMYSGSEKLQGKFVIAR